MSKKKKKNEDRYKTNMVVEMDTGARVLIDDIKKSNRSNIRVKILSSSRILPMARNVSPIFEERIVDKKN